MLSVSEFKTEDADKLTIYEGENTEGKQLYEFYGSYTPFEKWINTKSIYVTFASNEVFSYRGFKILLLTVGK